MRLDKLFKKDFITSDMLSDVKPVKETGVMRHFDKPPVMIDDEYKKIYKNKVLSDYMENKLSIICLPDDLNSLGNNKYFMHDHLTWSEAIACLPNEQTCFHFPISSGDITDKYGLQQIYVFFQKVDNQLHTAMMTIDTPKLNDRVTVHALQIVYDDFENCSLYRDPQKFNDWEENNAMLKRIDYENQSDTMREYIDWMTHFQMTALIVLTKFLANDKIVAEALINQTPPAKLVRKALKNNNFPPVRYKLLELKKFKSKSVKTGYVFPNRAKPSEHTRRGHIRIVNGVKIPVRACVVNKNIGTRIIKEYIVSQ
tara:strand:+ start:671 stop:1606 length:936 start_codon:yes stop_codon:yes gene_type:complete